MNKLLIIGIFALLGFTTNSYGWKCRSTPEVPEALYLADAVFMGRAISTTKMRYPPGITNQFEILNENTVIITDIDFYVTALEVTALLKGKHINKKVLVVTQGPCGFRFSEGEEYLVYSFWRNYYQRFGLNAPYLLYTDGSSRTKLRNDAEWKQLLFYRFSPWLLRETAKQIRLSNSNRSPWASKS